MRLRKAIKRIVALGTGLTMLGATMFGAMAAELSEYPSPFIKDGKFNGILVVGTGGADPAGLAADVIGVTDIIASLQYASTTAAGATTSTTSVSGDSWKVGSSSKKYEISTNLDSTAGLNSETLKNITSNIDKDDMKALADGSITNTKGTAPYHQYLHFEETDGDSEVVKYLENDDDVTADFFYIKSSRQIVRYELEFTTAFESDRDNSAGSATTDGTFLTDMENEEITLLGKEYTIVKARTSAPSGVDLTLFGGNVKDTLSEGEEKTYTVDGKEYKVTVQAITDTGTICAKFIINGETTRCIVDGDSDKTSSGMELGITDLIPNEAGDVTQDLVEFYLGAQKLFLSDTDITIKGTGEQSLKVNDETLSEAKVYIIGSNSSTEIKINNIWVNMTADDDFYIPAGGYLSKNPELDDPEALFTSNWDFYYAGLEDVKTENIAIKTSGKTKYQLVFADGSGDSVTTPLAYATSATTLKTGDQDNLLIYNESIQIKKNDWFVITDESQKDGERSTYVLRYKGADKFSETSPQIEFKNEGSGETIEKSLTNNGNVTADASITLGGQTYNIINATVGTSDDFDIFVDLNANGAMSSNEAPGAAGPRQTNVVAINTNYGAKIALANISAINSAGNALNVTITTPDTDDYETLAPNSLIFEISATTGPEVRLAEGSLSKYNFLNPEAEENTYYGYTSMGAFVKYDSPSSDPQTLDIKYPERQRLPQLYITAGAVSTSKTTGGAESVNIQRIEVGAAKLDSEVADVTAQNTLIIGGPCVNAAAAAAMGLPAGSCGSASGIPENKAVIKLFDNDPNVAMVIAGWNADDTRRASRVIANYQDYELSGMEVEVSGTSLTNIQVSKV